MQSARRFCETLADDPVTASSLYESDPVGPADAPFLNAVIQLRSRVSPEKLLEAIKIFEQSEGRDLNAPRWSNRPVDIDIIAYGSRVQSGAGLTLPHPGYQERLFVLLPLQEIDPNWTDPADIKPLSQLIERAPLLRVYKTALKW